MLRDDGIESAARLAIAEAPSAVGLIVLLDADDDCPRELGPALRARARAAVDRPVEVVAAMREHEAWFLAAAASLRGLHGLPPDLEPPPRPEEVRGAKEWLTARMPAGRSYKEMRHQAVLTDAIDLAAAATTRSFRQLRPAVDRIAGAAPR